MLISDWSSDVCSSDLDLALLKLQVVETNEKDYLDLCSIFADHELSEDDVGVNYKYVAELTASDWGLWRTVGIVSDSTESFASQLPGFEAANREIGRASGRERVGQYVWF